MLFLTLYIVFKSFLIAGFFFFTVLLKLTYSEGSLRPKIFLFLFFVQMFHISEFVFNRKLCVCGVVAVDVFGFLRLTLKIGNPETWLNLT